MRIVPIGERSTADQLPGILAIAALLLLFSILDPFSLIVINLSSLLFFLSGKATSRGAGLVGLCLFVFLSARSNGFSPAPLAVVVAGLSFGAILKYARFNTSFYPAVLSGLITVVSVVVLYALFDPGGLNGWVTGLRELMGKAMEESHLRLQDAGVLGVEELAGISDAMDGMVDVIVELLPAIVFMNIFLSGVLSVMILRLVTRGGCPLPRAGRTFSRFSFNDAFIWGIILGLLALLFPLPSLMDMVLLNVLTMSFIFYLLRGLAVGIFWLKGKGLSTVIIGSIYTFVFLVLPPLLIVCLFVPGLLDTWFNFRALGSDEVAGEQ